MRRNLSSKLSRSFETPCQVSYSKLNHTRIIIVERSRVFLSPPWKVMKSLTKGGGGVNNFSRSFDFRPSIELGFSFLNSIPSKSTSFLFFLSPKSASIPLLDTVSLHSSICPLYQDFGIVDEFFIVSLTLSFFIFFLRNRSNARVSGNKLCSKFSSAGKEEKRGYFGHRRRYFPFRNGSFPSFRILRTLRSFEIELDSYQARYTRYPRISSKYLSPPPPFLPQRRRNRVDDS